jgi:hypothetical protein
VRSIVSGCVLLRTTDELGCARKVPSETVREGGLLDFNLQMYFSFKQWIYFFNPFEPLGYWELIQRNEIQYEYVLIFLKINILNEVV